MKNLLFVVAFIVSISFVYADVCRMYKGYYDGMSFVSEDTLRSYDTLKVVKDTAFVMNMSTNNPFGGKNNFILNLTDIPDTSSCYPLLGSKVISDYGGRNGRKHTGVDIKTRPNDSIHAAFSGRVVMSSSYFGYGNCIVVRHYNGLETLYSHNSKNFVKVGDDVRAGQVIALTGRTGRATTEHLHFECKIKGCSFNPNKIFDHNKEVLRHGYLEFTNKGNSVTVKFIEIEEKKGL